MDDPQTRASLEQQLAAITRSLTDLAAAGLPESALTALRQQAAALQAQIKTAGGAVVGGDVSVDHGDFVGRDKFEFRLDPLTAPPADLLRAYYRSLGAECARLPLGVVHSKFAQPGREGDVALDQVYVDLDVASGLEQENDDVQAWGLRLARGEGQGRAGLLETLTQPQGARLVLLGDAGSGKSTFVNYLALLLANAAANDSIVEALPEPLCGLLPVRLILRDVAAHIPLDQSCGTATMLWDALRADIAACLGEVGAQRLWPYLQDRLLSQGGWFLLDGLDEVPEAGRRRCCLLEALQRLERSLPQGARVLLTARPYAYADPAWQLSSFVIRPLAPFDEGQIRRFVERWYQAVRPALGLDPETAEARSDQLVRALDERPYLADLASRPLLLTLMATLHSSGGQLPEDRADLYEESVRLLISRWQRGREKRDDAGKLVLEPGIELALKIGETRIRAALERLAFESHARQGAEVERHDAPADVTEAEVLKAFGAYVPDDVHPRVVLRYLETRAGLLIGRREGVYAFAHRSFQEYLAACHLANTESEFAEKLRALVWADPAWWREVFLLGVGKKRQGGLGDAVNVVTTLVPAAVAETDRPDEIHWRAAALAAEALLELKLPGHAAGKPHFEAVMRRVQGWLVALVEGGHLPARERAQAGDRLGLLGDPRPGVGVVPGTQPPLPEILWVRIPAGPFKMGSLDDDPEAYRDEIPQHPVDLPAFLISRYPITNAQYRPFVEGDGYDNPGYWTVDGWAWRNGAESNLDALEDVNEDAVKSYRIWLSGRQQELRRRPFYWHDPDLSLSNRPVVGITWFEAFAYARWLEEQLHTVGSRPGIWDPSGLRTCDIRPEALHVALPSEAEWEKAARGPDGLAYPWDSTWMEDRANTEEAGLKQTSTVGLFPYGASSYGVLDMSGNVWEWTRSRWGMKVREPDYIYPYVSTDGREDVDSPAVPILRGGSWLDDRRLARCAYRLRDVPGYFDHSVGFRVVVSLGDSES